MDAVSTSEFRIALVVGLRVGKEQEPSQIKVTQGGTLKYHTGAKGGIHQKEYSMCKALGTIPTSEMKQPNQAG